MFHPYSFYLQKHKNAKTKRESALPFFSLPLLIHLVIHAPIPPNRLWDVPFCLLGCPISPFGVSHFAFWDIPFRLLGCPISPFGVSHFAFRGIFSAHLRTIYSPDFRFAFFDFAAKYALFFVNWENWFSTFLHFCVFAFLCFCVLQMRNCFRSAIETNFIALTYSHFWWILIRHDKDTSKIEGWGCGRESDEGAKRKNGR